MGGTIWPSLSLLSSRVCGDSYLRRKSVPEQTAALLFMSCQKGPPELLREERFSFSCLLKDLLNWETDDQGKGRQRMLTLMLPEPAWRSECFAGHYKPESSSPVDKSSGNSQAFHFFHRSFCESTLGQINVSNAASKAARISRDSVLGIRSDISNVAVP